mgnify:CR=1 FL=1
MERLLSNEMARRILLLSMLHDTEDWITTEALSTRLRCSPKTIMMDCRYLENHWPEFLSIDTSKKHGVKLFLSIHHSVHEVYIDIIKSSEAFSLMETIFFYPGETSEELEKRCFMSSSTLYRLTKKFKQPLKERNMTLSRNPFVISGKSEREIRFFFTAYFVEAYGIHHWPFQLKKDKIIQLVRRINDDFQLYLSDIRMMHMAFSIAVTITRISQGFVAQSEMREKDRTTIKKQKGLHQAYRQDLDSIIDDTHLSADCNWYRDFYYTVFWWIFGWDSEKEHQHVHKLGGQLIETIAEDASITIDALSKRKIIQTIENIYCQHMIFPYKNFMIYSRFFYSSKSIQQNSLYFSSVVSKRLFQIEQAENFPWKSMYFNELLHDMAIYWDDLPKLLTSRIAKVSITVFSDLGKEHAEALGSILIMNFPDKISVKTQSGSFFDITEENKLLDSDLYVSNFSNDHFPQSNTVDVDEDLNQKDLAEMKKSIESIRINLFTESKKALKSS